MGAGLGVELSVLGVAVRRALFFAGMTSATDADTEAVVVVVDADGAEEDEVREDAYPPCALYVPAPGRTMRPGWTRPFPAPAPDPDPCMTAGLIARPEVVRVYDDTCGGNCC